MKDSTTAPSLARRMGDIAPFQVMEVQRRAFELEAAGRHIIHMEIGQPDFAAPPQVLAAGMKAMQEQSLGYSGALGIPELREAIAGFYESRFGINLDPGRIMITAGASGAFLLAMGALLDPGDEVLLPDPSYPCTRHFVRLFEGVSVPLPVGPAQRYQPDSRTVEDAWGSRTRGLVLASPSNPTGTTIEQDELRRIADIVAKRNGFLLVDEIYQGLTYDHPAWSALEVRDDCLVVNSFSKYFGMTGWRLGWLVAPQALVDEMERLAQNAFICASTPAQYAALAAFQPDTLALLEQRRLEFQRRRDFLVPALRELGFSVPAAPDGAFYVYAGCERYSNDSRAFALRLLEEAGVAVTPGCDFGTREANTHLRFAYTRGSDELKEAVDRLSRFLSTLS